MKNYLSKMAEKIGISLTDEMLTKFEIFYRLLLDANRYMNLTAITDKKEVVLKHFIDSIALINFVDLSRTKIIDVGTGAGFPGIPLAIMFPDAQFVLMDSLNKRLKFINQVIEDCHLENVKTVHGRAEDLGQMEEYREKFDYCVSRAVAFLPVLLELCIPFVKVNGKLISYKSELLAEELEQSEHALSILHCTLEEKYSYTIPDSNIFRVFAVFSKNKILERKYPRPAGKLKKKPL